jgi:ribonuclease D
VSLSPYILVTTPNDWQQCLTQLKQQKRIALDFEANSMYAYREQVCLIQISIPGRDYILDPLAPFAFTELGEIVEDESVEKILHAAEYDLMLVKREYGWRLRNLFDTMWAARILGYNRVGLASILKDLYQVELNKRLQKANWCQRPLSTQHLHYAQCDTHYLLSLHQHLQAELEIAGRVAEAQETFLEQSQVEPATVQFDPAGFWSIHGAHDLSRQGQAVLQALYLFRDQEARARNQPLFKVFGDKTMLQLAEQKPAHLNDLYGIHGMSAGQIRRYGRKLIYLIQEASQSPPPPFPQRNSRPPAAVLERYEKLHSWRKERAFRRAVESDVILSRDALWAIAQAEPRSLEELRQVKGLGPWRFQAYGPEILNVLQK